MPSLSHSIASHSARRVLAGLAVLALGSLLFMAACGDDDDSESQQYFSRAANALREFVPEMDNLNLRYLATTPDTEEDIDLVMGTRLEGNPRMHIVSDDDAIRDALNVGTYQGTTIYQKANTFWAELPREEGALQVFAGTPSREGLQAYLDFYAGGAELESDRFWAAFSYAEDRITGEAGDDPYLLVVDYERVVQIFYSGIRVETTSGQSEIAVSALYENGEAGAPAEVSEEVLALFKQRFAVTNIAQEEPESPWDYPARVWFGVRSKTTPGPDTGSPTETSEPSASPEASATEEATQ